MNVPLRLLVSFTVSGLVWLTAPAQVPDGASNTYINATNAFVDVTIGTNGSFTLLTLGNNAMFTNAGNGVIGLNATARSNEVRLISPTARWFVGNQIHVGSNGSFNRLLVSNGATVRAFNGNLGLGSGSNNLAMVTGSGSVWSNANLFYLGFNGAGNQLVLSNGGVLYNNNGYLGINSSSFSNAAIVTGPGSLWSNRSDFVVGFGGAAARLEVSNGGYLRNRVGNIGAQTGATNIMALVTGAGSTWSNAAQLYVGLQGPANQLVVNAGGTVRSAVGYVGANFTASNNLALVSGAGSMWSIDVALLIGSFSSNNRLVVSNEALVTAANNAVIGPTANGNANSVRVTDVGSRWHVGGTLYVGSNSALNQLVITNGGAVSSVGAVSGAVGWGTSASNNLALVTGPGSIWSNYFFFYVGGNAVANQLVVSNGGLVLSQQSTMGLDIPASNTMATVTGPGSRWETKGGLYLGFSSAANRAEVKDGGVIYNGSTTLSANVSSSNNLALVGGPGSAWTNTVALIVGGDGPRNQLVVSNGGVAFVGEVMTVGVTAGSTNNRVVVDGGTLQVAHPAKNAVLEVRRGTNVLNTGLVDVDRLLMTNALSRFDFNGGTLITRGAAISNGFGLLIGATTNPAIWAVHPGLSDHVLGVPLVVGISAPFNQLLITNGAVMRSSNYALSGAGIGSVSNLVVISGTNSSLLLRDLYVGYSGNHNGLVVSNSGFLGADYSVVGGEGNTTNCEAVITGQGSVMSNSNGLQIGSSGSFNRVRIEDGGALIGIVQVGRTTESIGNVLSVTGADSRVDVLTNLNPISIGFDGSASRMEINAGGAVFGYEGEVGRNISSSNNLVQVIGTGSVWSNASDLRIGVSGAGNRLEVTNGGALHNYNGALGVNTYSSNNQAWVIGPGSTWTNYRELSVGLNGIGNQLVVTNGGTVFAFANKYVGNNDGALSNTVVVTDPGSAWLGDDSLYVGSDGSFNRLLVRNGGRVVNGLGTLGGLLGADGNQAVVTDGGSAWTNHQELTVGDSASANTLIVSNGATVFSASDGFIGRSTGANSNAVVVTDLGTRLLISSNLYVGSNGAFSQLAVANGAQLENRGAVIGAGLSSSSNEVFITGFGSIWSNRGSLHLGESGGGNRLRVENGGRIDSLFSAPFNLEIGVSASSSNNEAIVTGAGSFCLVRDTLILGSFSGGNRLVVSNGASFHNDNAHIGLSGTNNEALITGPGTTWTNRSGMYVGRFRGGNRLMIADGAFVFSRDVSVGSDPSSTNNLLVMNGGTLLITNSTGIGALNVLRGTNVFSSGLIDTSNLWLTNTLSWFQFNGGTLITSGTTNSNGRAFTIGDGINGASFQLRGGLHSFANGITVANHGLLTGAGTVLGTVNVATGGRLSPGTTIGVMALTNSPVLQGMTIMDIGRNAGVLTNDQVRIAGPLAYGGSLVVNDSGTSALISGDRFPLFSASTFSGAFTNILLPPLPVNLQWTNKLLIDGSIEVVPYEPPPVVLTVQRSNDLLLVSWPTNGVDYCLETTFDLSPPALWETVSGGITTNGGSFWFTLTNTSQAPKQFFRLAFPCSQTPVTLTLEASGNLLTVSWPSNSFRLETTFSLAPPVNWQTIDSGITNTGELRVFSFTNNAAVPNQFFRLASP